MLGAGNAASAALILCQRAFWAADIRAIPSGVLGPVDIPPWLGQRPLARAFRLQGWPSRRVRAPQVWVIRAVEASYSIRIRNYNTETRVSK